MSYAVWVELEVKSEHHDEFLNAITENQAATLNEPGCTFFEVVRLDRAGIWYAFYEIYRDKIAFEKEHRSFEHYLVWREAVAKTVVPNSQSITTGSLVLRSNL